MLRQVSNNGIVAVGMTLVILTGGIDLSVGSIMALGSVLCAMLLTMEGWTIGRGDLDPGLRLVVLFVWWPGPCLALGGRATRQTATQPPRTGALVGLGVGAVVAALRRAGGRPRRCRASSASPACWPWCRRSGWCSGALNGFIIAKGRLQPFIVTLAMMVGVSGMARLVTGQDAVGRTGLCRHQRDRGLRACCGRCCGASLPVPGLFFLAACALFAVLLGTTTFGRYVYAIGGNEQATRLSGVAVDRVKIAVYALSGMLASLAGVLYTAQYLQGKPDAGEGIELDAIAAVVIGGTSLMGGKGSIGGTLVGVLIFGFLSNILQLNNIDSNTQLVLKGVIILAAVLLQEGQAGRLLGPLRGLVAAWPPGPRRGRSRSSADPSCRGPTGQIHRESKMERRTLIKVTAVGLRRRRCCRSGRRSPQPKISDRLLAGDHPRDLARPVQQGHEDGGREASRDRADHRRRPEQDRKAGRRRRELHQPGRRRADRLAQGIGRADAGGREGDRCRHPGDHPRPQRQHRQASPSSSAATTW